MSAPVAERVEILDADSAGLLRRYREFRRQLYAGDPGYSTTLEFPVESVLARSTAFTRGCHTRPLLAIEGGDVVSQCVLVHDANLPLLQVAFFEALPGRKDAVDALLAEARAEARRRGLDRVIVGLDAHLSIGVGILTEGFQRASFDSTWNKPYYAGYFDHLERVGLTSYTGSVPTAVAGLVRATRRAETSAVSVRPLERREWRRELETFRQLCDATLGATPGYAPTRPGHFEELLDDPKPFLRPENLLFAELDGRAVGCCFWHPDYNEILPTGRHLGTASIAWRFALRRSRIRTVVLNAIGVLPEFRGVATTALLGRVAAEIDGRFDRYETSFVWDGNDASTGVGRHLGNQVLRRFAVWFDEVPA